MGTNIEIWKQLPITDRYDISNTGKVFDTQRCRMLPLNKFGQYQGVCIHLNGKKEYFGVHRLVYWAFRGVLSDMHTTQINHKDENKLNNHIDNLELLTPHENWLYSYIRRTGKINI